jgi:hypothetical protein
MIYGVTSVLFIEKCYSAIDYKVQNEILCLAEQKVKEVIISLKEWDCIKVKNYKDVGKTIEEWQKNGWRLHTYACTQYGIGGDANHYLLFEREKGKKIPPVEAAAAAAAGAS